MSGALGPATDDPDLAGEASVTGDSAGRHTTVMVVPWACLRRGYSMDNGHA